MPDKTAAERMKRMRAKKAKDGLVELKIWCKPENRERIRKYAKNLTP